MIESDSALLRLLEALGRRGYRFITPTPATHARVIARVDRREARNLADVLGWSLPFAPGTVDAEILALLFAAGAVDERPDRLLQSRLRVSSLAGHLYLHSAFPTDDEESVFFGPDSYRFADLITAELAGCELSSGAVVDIGTGAGVGAIIVATMHPEASVWMTDVNSSALRLAAINVRAAKVAVSAVESATLAEIDGPIALALANPPFLVDAGARTYRHGGGMLGGQVSLDMARMATGRLVPSGRLILYTGSAIVGGVDLLRDALWALADAQGCDLDYRELDPDVFGEELDEPAYRLVDRIAAVAAIFTKR